jgi:uncharacterized protein YigA (DUF484 family)
MSSAANLLSLPNCVVCGESAFATELCGLQRTSFRCRIVVLAANLFSLLNCGACNESVFAAKLRWLHRISSAADLSPVVN